MDLGVKAVPGEAVPGSATPGAWEIPEAPYVDYLFTLGALVSFWQVAQPNLNWQLDTMGNAWQMGALIFT